MESIMLFIPGDKSRMASNLMKHFVLILLMVFVPLISADCEDGQIDINSASLEELDEIVGIGPAYAGRIVENRPFESVDDLIKVSGIGEVTLENIKVQGLACVDSEEVEDSDEPEVVEEEVVEESVSPRDDSGGSEEDVEESIEEVEEIILFSDDGDEKEVEIISLNSKVVEKKDDLVYVSKDAQVVSYLPYGFAVFLIFIIGFLAWEKR